MTRPEIVKCPDCGSADNVGAWEAWGVPNGDLVCFECMGYDSGDVPDDYHTFRVVDGETVIIHWEDSTEVI